MQRADKAIVKPELVAPDRRILSLYTITVFVAVLVIWFVQTKDQYGSWSDASRLATIESLVERGTWQIDESQFFRWTGDKVFLQGHFYSEKPPLLQVFAATPYAAMYHLFGLRLKTAACLPGEICVYKWLTFLTVGVPSALLIALFFWAIAKLTASFWRSLFATILLACGTMIWPYSLVLNNHLPAAACLFAAFYLVLSTVSSPGAVEGSQPLSAAQKRLFWAGLAAGLSASFDLTAAVIGVALFAIVAIRCRKGILPFVLGAALPVFATMILNYQISGTPLPAYFLSVGYNYPGSVWDNTFAAHHPPEDVIGYGFQYLVGDRGFVAHAPVLIWAMLGLFLVLRNRRHRIHLESAILATALVVQMMYMMTRTNHFGGRAYGERFFIILVPLFMYYLPFAWPSMQRPSLLSGKHDSDGRVGVRGVIAFSFSVGLLVIAAGLSTLSAAQGVGNTWVASRPPLSLYTRPDVPYVDVHSRLSRKLLSGPDGWMRWIMCPRWELEESTILTKPPAMEHRVSANFEGKLMLLGYDLPSRRVRAGESMPITVYWQVLSPITENYVQSNQLLDEQLARMGGLDRRPLGSNTACWEPGEILVDHYNVPVVADAPDGVYQLLIGLYHGEAENATYVHLVQAGQPTEVANVTIEPIKVGPAPHGSTITEASPQHSNSSLLGSIIRLLGYDSSVVTATGRGEPALQLRFYWQSVAQTDVDYSVFVHLLDSQGNIVSQKDHLLGRYRPANTEGVESSPAERQYPTSVWDPGDVIADEIVLPLPAGVAGGSMDKKWSLEVGLYDLVTGQRLTVPGGPDGAIRLAEME
jgi:hypothetical protein